MDLTHYAEQPVTLDRKRTYLQHEPHGHGKPVGLWVSVDGEDDWAWWNISEREDDSFLSRQHAHRVVLATDARITRIECGEALELFHAYYSVQDRHARQLVFTGRAGERFAYRQRPIDWAEVATQCDGILIAPYLWSHRLDGPHFYYGWDCASGCIWNLDAIESFELKSENDPRAALLREGESERPDAPEAGDTLLDLDGGGRRR